MGLFPFADIIATKSTVRSAAARYADADWDAVWWCRTPSATVHRTAPALLPLDDHHDIDLDSKCTRRGSGLAGAFALRLP